MRQYVIDELNHPEMEKIRKYLKDKCDMSELGNIFWLNMPSEILTQEQAKHSACAPHVTAVELHEKAVYFEMLVRSRNVMRCSCIGFATNEQRDFILNFVDEMILKIGLKV